MFKKANIFRIKTSNMGTAGRITMESNKSILLRVSLTLALILAVGGVADCKSREDDEDDSAAVVAALLNNSTGLNSNFNGTVKDSLGNTWMKCSYGQTFESKTDQCTGTGGGTTYNAQSMAFCTVEDLCTDTTTLNANSGPAYTACEDLTLAGLTTWRLPDYTELVSLINGQTRDSFLIFFPQTPDDKNFWTRTEPSGGDSDAYSVSFASSTMAQVDTENKVTTSNYVRCIVPK